MLTLETIKSKSPCGTGWVKLLYSFNKTKADNTEVSIAHLLQSNGIRRIEDYIEEEVLKWRKEKNESSNRTINSSSNLLFNLGYNKNYIKSNNKDSTKIINNFKRTK